MKKLLTLLLTTTLLAQSMPAVAYTVKPGDTLFAIARAHGTTVKALVAANGIANPDLILAGQSLDLGVLGASIPTVVADFDDSLASRITSSASSLTLTRGTVASTGASLSGLYGFRIDDEYMTATCVATACTIVARGLDPIDGSSSVTALKAEHRRGAVVKISNFPQLALISRMLNGQDSIPGNIYSSSTTYVPPSAAYFASKYYVDSVGAGGFTANNVSSTLGLQAISSGIPNCPSAAACVGINVSSTGGVYVDSGGKVAFSGIVNTSTLLNGNVTSSARLDLLNQPTTTYDVVNMGALQNLTATGTAGMTIAAGNLVALSPTTSRLTVADSSVSGTSWGLVGVALNAASVGGLVTFARANAIVGGFSSLVPGSTYYLSTSGAVSLLRGTVPVSIGIAYSTSTMLLKKPGFRAVASGSQASLCSGGQSLAQTISFVPTKVSMRCSMSSVEQGSGMGTWFALSNGASSSNSLGGSIGATNHLQQFSSACGFLTITPTTYLISVATTTAGFNLTCNQSAAAVDVSWVAELDEQ